MGGIPQCHQVRITLTAWPKHTVVTVTTRDGSADFRWDKRRGTWDLPVPGASLDPQAIRGLVEGLVEALRETL